MLFFIYSGRSPGIQMMALDLLAAADRFQLNGLKEMADQVYEIEIYKDLYIKFLYFTTVLLRKPFV